MAEVKTKWLASLSDGSTAIEGTAPFDIIPGAPSPWLRLQEHLSRGGLHITGLRIQVERIGEATRTYNLPSMSIAPGGQHKKFRHLRPILPEAFNYFRTLQGYMSDGQTIRPDSSVIEIRAIYPDFELSIIVDENEGTESWGLIHED